MLLYLPEQYNQSTDGESNFAASPIRGPDRPVVARQEVSSPSDARILKTASPLRKLKV